MVISQWQVVTPTDPRRIWETWGAPRERPGADDEPDSSADLPCVVSFAPLCQFFYWYACLATAPANCALRSCMHGKRPGPYRQEARAAKRAYRNFQAGGVAQRSRRRRPDRARQHRTVGLVRLIEVPVGHEDGGVTTAVVGVDESQDVRVSCKGGAVVERVMRMSSWKIAAPSQAARSPWVRAAIRLSRPWWLLDRRPRSGPRRLMPASRSCFRLVVGRPGNGLLRRSLGACRWAGRLRSAGQRPSVRPLELPSDSRRLSASRACHGQPWARTWVSPGSVPTRSRG